MKIRSFFAALHAALLCILLAASPAGSGSMTLLGVGKAGAGGGGCSQATAFLARNGNANSAATTTLICGLVSDSTYSGFDAFWIMATDTGAHANLNVISTSFTLVPTNSPTFTANVGYTSIFGASAFLDTQFIPSTSGTQFTTNSGSIGVCIQTNDTSSGNNVDMGSIDGGTNTVQIASNFSLLSIYDVNDAITPTPASTTSLGTWSASRTAASGAGALSLYHNSSATPVDTQTGASSSKPAFSIFIGGRNNSGTLGFTTSRQYSFAWVARGFTGAEYASIEARLSAYMTAIGGGGC